MAKPDDLLTDRVAQRIQVATDEIDRIRSTVAGETDPNRALQAALDGHRAMLNALTEIVGMLAVEIERLKH